VANAHESWRAAAFGLMKFTPTTCAGRVPKGIPSFVAGTVCRGEGVRTASAGPDCGPLLPGRGARSQKYSRKLNRRMRHAAAAAPGISRLRIEKITLELIFAGEGVRWRRYVYCINKKVILIIIFNNIKCRISIHLFSVKYQADLNHNI
jgi:hypothetical protein